jgi:hypothetical protein
LAECDKSPLQRGIATLRSIIGADAVNGLLQEAAVGVDDAASFYLPLPVDYTGLERRLKISFPKSFPDGYLRLNVEPSPWLVWPHAMKSGLCLHGFRERPITGSPETIVKDSFSRFSKIVALSVMGSDAIERENEFKTEIVSYWFAQHGQSLQNLILVDRPQVACRLFALSDPRQALPSGQETIWLSTDVSKLRKHHHRVVGRYALIRAAETPGFYVKLKNFPDIKVPGPEGLLSWLTPHLEEGDAISLLSWFEELNSVTSRWIVLELPGAGNPLIYCLNIRSYGMIQNRGRRFGMRTARRRLGIPTSRVPASVMASTLDVLDRETMLSRDLSDGAKTLESRRVVCVGVGSLGSAVAMQLARSGVGHLTLIDPEILVSANLGRHVLGADDLGKSKAVTLQERMRRDLPTVEGAAFPTYSEIVMLVKPQVFEQADLVIVTTADWSSEVALWEKKSKGASWGLLQAWSEPHTHVGHALFAPSGAFDARSMFSANGDFLNKFTEWPNDGVVALPACGQSFIPGGTLGLTNIAAMVSQAAVRALTNTLCVASWVSSISEPHEMIVLGGKYIGPDLPQGARQIVLERVWPI